MKRRNFLLGSTAALVVGGLALRPADHSQPYSPYFKALNAKLRQHLPASIPRMLLDQSRLAENCQYIRQITQKNAKDLRLVVKSLPSLPLLAFISEQVQTDKFMVFHQPYINTLVNAMPHADLLLGKPMPVQAVARFYHTLAAQNQKNASTFQPSKQLQWLIDTKARLLNYVALAKQLAQPMRVNIEIDVGLHRGGISTLAELDAMLAVILANPQYLTFSGFMGYDAHVGKLPSIIETTEASLAKSQAIYHSFIQHLEKKYPQLLTNKLCFNGAGSPTFALHTAQSPINEVSVGSAFVKPSDFDVPSLTALKPAAFISTPVLKSGADLKLPGAAWLGQAWQTYDVNKRHHFFIYGGNWLANPISPAGLSANDLYGYSSNQELYTAANDLGLAVNDLIFFRPTQSEAVLKQFGSLLVINAGTVSEWSVFD